MLNAFEFLERLELKKRVRTLEDEKDELYKRFNTIDEVATICVEVIDSLYEFRCYIPEERREFFDEIYKEIRG